MPRYAVMFSRKNTCEYLEKVINQINRMIKFYNRNFSRWYSFYKLPYSGRTLFNFITQALYKTLQREFPQN